VSWATSAAQSVSLLGSLTSLEDVDGTMKPESAWQRIASGDGERVQKHTPNYGVTDSTYWFSIPVGALSLDRQDDWVLEVNFGRLRDVQFFSMSEGGDVLESFHSTVSTPLRERAIYGRSYLFPINNLPEVVSILIRVQSSVPMQVPILLQNRSASEASRVHRDFAEGLYFGLALIMMLYNLTIFLFTREAMYLMYSSLVGSFAGLVFISHGFGYYVFPDSWAVYYVDIVMLGTIVPALCIAGFILLFFDLRRRDNGSARVLYGLLMFMLARLALYNWLSSEARSLSGLLIGSAFVSSLLAITARQIWLKQPGARLLFMAWSAFLGGILIFYCNRLGLLPRNNFTEYAMLIGSALEITMLSVAIPHRLQLLKRERKDIVGNLASVTQDLEKEVNNREALTSEVGKLRGNIRESQVALDGLRQELGASENQLIQAEKMASVGQLVASVTHDIANPTTHILVSQSAMEKKIEDILKSEEGELTLEDIKIQLNSILRYGQFIRTGAKSIADIHRSFAYYSRPDAHMRPSVDIEKVLKDAMMILITRVQPHVLRTEFLDCPRISCRPSEVCQLVANLVSNAADAISGVGVENGDSGSLTSAGDIALRVGPLRHENQDGVEIAVHDSGPGIADSDRESIFKPFVTTKEAGKGTGLGLAITQRIVARHEGHIFLGLSDELGGALFRVWLPLVQSQKIDVVRS
jgi:two-component system, NtrC family, sensor kinase